MDKIENEKRGAVRYPAVLSVRYNVNATYIEGLAKTCDISEGGAKLEVAKDHCCEDRLGLMIEGLSGTIEPLCIEADVVWRKKITKLFDQECNYLVGVAFRRIRDSHKSIILSHAAENGMLQSSGTRRPKTKPTPGKLRFIDYGFGQ